ncbi:hypothetical protein SAY86_011682 [Trapa natans]|uniref:Uncharacterized protein n=1 Tax=Trapa natans TaxID=22666 RepID=A0AAN7R0V9_TRANT|nr:hypothetical protein SAY86_011682 [Trapa natans]
MDQTNGESSSSSATAAAAAGGGIVVSKQRKAAFQGIRIQNPFTFKVGQVFTGFGVGCGVGIGVGRPINMGAIPVVNQVMGAARGATDALSGVTGHMNSALRKIGAKNIQAGIGCGVGFGHGFGVGLALKPGIINQMQSGLITLMTKMMSKLGMGSNLPIGPGALSGPLQSGMGLMKAPLSHSAIGNVTQMGTTSVGDSSQMLSGYGNISATSYQSFASSSPTDISVESRTEKVLSNFLQNPALKQGDDTELNDLIGSLRSENNMLQMVIIFCLYKVSVHDQIASVFSLLG